MSYSVILSIVICTRNNERSLQSTLNAIVKCDVPSSWSVELIVVDNGPSEIAASVVRDVAATTSKILIRYCMQAEPGLSRARNRGLRESTGQVIMFTDDDIVPPITWLHDIAGPILMGQADAVSGGVKLGPEVSRPWFKPAHQFCMACTDGLDWCFVGANMGFARRVVDKVQSFDPELGAGALGFGEENLFIAQVRKAGFRVLVRADVSVIHNPRPERIRYDNWIDSATRQGRSDAYIFHHWQQLPTRFPTCRATLARLILWLGRKLSWWASSDPEFAHHREMAWVLSFARFSSLARLKGQPKNYEKEGLRKLRGIMP